MMKVSPYQYLQEEKRREEKRREEKRREEKRRYIQPAHTSVPSFQPSTRSSS
jgi:hypothetical protein